MNLEQIALKCAREADKLVDLKESECEWWADFSHLFVAALGEDLCACGGDTPAVRECCVN